jgi:hypothetical protein
MPLGWGAAEAAADAQGWLHADPGGVRFNPVAAALAEADLGTRTLPGAQAWRGIAAVRDLDPERIADARFPLARIAVLARDEGSLVRGAAGAMRGRLALSDRFAAGRLWSLAVAEVYFRAPPGLRAEVEYASLYSPYWQARLAEPTEAERAQARSHVR